MRPLTQHRQRVSTALVGLPVLVAAVSLQSHLPFFALAAVSCLICLFEYFAMLFPSDRKLCLTGVAVGFLPVAVIISGRLELLLMSVYLILLVPSFVFVLSYEKWHDPLRSWAAFVAGAMYLGVSFAHLLLLRQFEQGRLWIFFLLLVIFASDIGAYYAGHAFGSRKLAPALSNGKTVEGSAGGIVSGMAAGVCVWLFFFKQDWTISGFCFVCFTSFFITVVGQAGDLVESLVKRSANVKDSGSLLPGHGGFFDRLDAVILAAPCLYWLLELKKLFL